MSPQAGLVAIATPLNTILHSDTCFAGVADKDPTIHGKGYHCNTSGGDSAYTGCSPAMPGQISPQPLLASLASPMSVFGNGLDHRGSSGPEVETKSLPKFPAGWNDKQHSQTSSVSSQLFRRDSASTFESADSSPTTTVSTMDSALTEPSPSSSPESATSMLPIASFKSLSTSSIATTNNLGNGDSSASPFPTLPGVHRADSPNKKMRNMKNLSVNISASARQVPQLPKLSLGANSNASSNHAFSAPPTPSFIVPPKPPRKRPSNLGLTISTPESGSSSQSNDSTIQAVPSTPADPQQRTLRYLQTASTMPMISSPTVAPEGGMRLPPFGNVPIPGRIGKARPPLNISRHSSVDSQASPIRLQMLEHVQEEPDYDLPLSREAKSPAYPQGPVCIYDPGVYLYLEPSDTEASQFDVVLNVAREVKNPFTAAANRALVSDVTAPSQPASHLGDANADSAEHSSNTEASGSGRPFNTTFSSIANEEAKSVSSTPKPINAEPEYIHIPWDHNTNLVDDLLRLCELIDQRVQDGKRVLVHCQCGVSRSASLVVAYGLYKNPELSVQEAYDAVKSRSRWIGPNMNLIYQLNEFRSKLPKNIGPSFTNWQGWKHGSAGRLNASSALSSEQRSSRPPSSHRNSHQEPLIASSRKEHELTPVRANSFSPPGSALFTQTSASEAVSPGPSSAPPDVQWSPSKDAEEGREHQVWAQEPEQMPVTAVKSEDDSKAKEEFNRKHETSVIEDDSAIKLVEPRNADMSSPNGTQQADSMTTAAPLPTGSPKPLPGGFSSIPTRKQVPRPLPFRQLPQVEVDRSVVDEVPKTPSLLSPRAAEFTASPFHRTAAGDLAGSSVFEQTLISPKPSQDDDPRSPVQKGEAPITRNIFDVL
ncbi:MAG: hypothetical protein Q9166_006772 [cf. Caloplaca sp. 2 TL-2023]